MRKLGGYFSIEKRDYLCNKAFLFLVLPLFFLLFLSTNSYAQFTAGRLVVVQTSGSVSKGGSAVTLQEYSTTGTVGTAVSIPSTGATPFQMAAGSGGSEGFLTKSPDGTFLTLAGYATATTNITDITTTSAASVPRVIFKVNALGTATQVGSSTTAYTANDIRGAISDGTNFWASGASNTGVDGINYYGPSTPVALAVSAKAYGLQIFNNQIYFSTQKVVSGVTPYFGIYALGTGMPTSGTITPTLVINTGTATPQDFSFNPTVDVCYIANSLNTAAGGIQKWTKTASVWSLAYTLPTGATNIGAYGLVVDYSGANPVLYATTNESNTTGNRIIKITDTGAAATATTIVTGAANTWFHGISFSPSCQTPVQPTAFTTSSSTVDLGQSAVAFTVPNDAVATTYTWAYSGNGATINGSGNSVTVDFSKNATNGVLSVTASNSCGTSIARSMPIVINGAMRITEFMYSGSDGEFVEFTNVGGADVNMSGWSFDSNTRTPGSHDLTAIGVVKPGESIIGTETDAATFRTKWGLCAGIKIVGGYTSNKLGRSDEVNLYNGTTLIDRLTYNDQTAGGGPRTQNKSAWVSATGLGNNTAAQWTLSGIADSEASFSSASADIGSPGKSTMANVVYNPCLVVSGAPTIVINASTTTNFIDGGVAGPIASPFSFSGVLNDPTDPASTLGIDFTINDTDTSVSSLIVTATSSNKTVVPTAGLVLTGSSASRNLKITPNAVGYSTITVTVTDGVNNTVFTLSYAASAAATTPAATVWHTGMSDASDGIVLDDNYFVTGDDELNILNVYSRNNSGLPLVSFDYTSYLALPIPAKPEVDLEAAAKSPSTNKTYWIGSMSNSKSFTNSPNRDRIFATTITGTGAATAFAFNGYTSLRSNILTWGDSYGYNFTASAAEGVDSKLPNGFAVEGMVFGPDNSTLFIAMRAPMVPTANRKNAVIVPVSNFETWFNNGNPSGNPTFAAPIELDLGGRGFRDLIRLSNGTYIIVAGNPEGSPITSAIYKWSGNTTEAPVLVNTSVNGILNLEGVMEVKESGNISLTKLQVISDGGGDILYNDGTEAKDFNDLNLRKFRSDFLNSIDLVLNSPVLSITKFESNNNFVISPNPSKGVIIIKSNTNGDFLIMNQLGQKLKEFKVKQDVDTIVDLENLSNGVYFISNTNQEKRIIQKLILKK